jgi:hypothetical protein
VTRVALFAAGLAGAFLAAFVAGTALDLRDRTVAEAAAHGEEMSAPAGLALEQDGYRLVQERDAFTAGRAEPYEFRILGPDGEVVRELDVEHERRLHLIVVSRAPEKVFLHLHPRQRADGSWSVPLRLPVNGSYRVFADFTTEGERRTLGRDLVGHSGPGLWADPIPQYDVDLDRAGERLEFRVQYAGNPVKVQPYLGAGGHLVVLREGDLAYIHAHAEEDELAFDVPFPSDGRYRLYLQFKVGGKVETAQFEVER